MAYDTELGRELWAQPVTLDNIEDAIEYVGQVVVRTKCPEEPFVMWSRFRGMYEITVPEQTYREHREQRLVAAGLVEIAVLARALHKELPLPPDGLQQLVGFETERLVRTNPRKFKELVANLTFPRFRLNGARTVIYEHEEPDYSDC